MNKLSAHCGQRKEVNKDFQIKDFIFNQIRREELTW